MTSASVLTWTTSREEFRPPLSTYRPIISMSSILEDSKELAVPSDRKNVPNPIKTRGKRKIASLKMSSMSSTTSDSSTPVKVTHPSLPSVVSHPLPRPKIVPKASSPPLMSQKGIREPPDRGINNNNEDREINVEDDESDSGADDDQPEDLSVRKRDQQCQTEIPFDVKRDILASILDQGLARGVLATLMSNRPRLKADDNEVADTTSTTEPFNPKPESVAPSPSTSKFSADVPTTGTSDNRLKELYLTTLNFLLLRTRKLLQSSSSSSLDGPSSSSFLSSRPLQEAIGSRLQPVCVSSKSKGVKCSKQDLSTSLQPPLSPNQPRAPRLSLEDLLRTSHPEGLLRNVSLHQGFNQAHGLNDSFPIPGSGDQSSNTDLAFGASSLANLTSTANVQTTVEAQSSGEAPFGITDTEIIKEIFNVFGGRDLHEVENWGAPVDGSSASSSSANPGNGSSLSTSNGRQQHRNDLSQAASASSSSTSTNAQGAIRHESLSEDPYSNGSATPTFDNGSLTPSPYAAAMLSAATIPGYSGYNPYLAAATGRYPHTAPTPYTPLMNHSYAAVAAAASLNPSQSTPTLGGASATSSGAMALDDLDSASHTSGKSSMSKDFSFDPTSIKQEPEEFSSSSCGSGVGRSRQCRDEKKARELGVTFSIDDIINLPMDEFNDMLSRQELTEEQLNLCRDIRRRGKNKVAAQNCRKRKIDQIAQLEEEVHRARTRKQNLLMERETLFRQRDEWRSKLMGVEEDILSGMGRNTKEFRLDFGTPDVRILRRDELIVGRQPSDHLETNRYAQTGPSSSSDTSQHPNFNWKSDSNQHS